MNEIKIGYRFGNFTIIDRTDLRKSGRTVWKCRCVCGNEDYLDTRHIQRGTKTDCGCITKVPRNIRDLTGQIFGRLVVLEISNEKRKIGSAIWKCRCECGNLVNVPAGQLTSGYVKSCGCLSHPPLKELIGKRYNDLTVIAYIGKHAGQHRWLCRCELCGNTVNVGQTRLQSGKSSNCGCAQTEAARQAHGRIDGTSIRLLEFFRDNLASNNISGHTGVYQNKKNGRWHAQITFQGKTKFLGSFSDINDAIHAREKAEKERDVFLEQFYLEHPEWTPMSNE